MNEQKPLAWMDEAFKHIGIKEIKGPETHPEIAKMLIEVKAGWKGDEIPWCLQGDIEVLTDQGFVRLDKIKEVSPQKVAQLNRDTHEIEYVDDYGYIEKPYEGDVYHNTKIGIISDPEHRFYGKWIGKGKYDLRPIKTITKTGIGIPNIFAGQNEYPITDSELLFLAAFLSDGYYRNDNSNIVRFRFAKKHKQDIIEQFEVRSVTDDEPRDGRLPSKAYTFDVSLLRKDVLSDYKLMNWDFVRNLSARQARLFVDSYSYFDGTRSKDGSFELFTADKRLQEQLLFIATMGGYKATPYATKQVSPNTKIEYLYNVYVSTKRHRYIMSHHLKLINYTGTLYCLQVPSSIMIIRTTTGVILPIGNCGIFAGAVLKRAGRAYPVTAPGWALSYRNNGVILKKPAYGAIITKKRNGGGHVCFVAGITENGMIVGLGGNQSDSVNLALFKPNELTYTWPALADGKRTVPTEERYNLPVYDSKTLTLSVKED